MSLRHKASWSDEIDSVQVFSARQFTQPQRETRRLRENENKIVLLRCER